MIILSYIYYVLKYFWDFEKSTKLPHWLYYKLIDTFLPTKTKSVGTRRGIKTHNKLENWKLQEMAVVAGRTQIGLKPTSHSVTVPNDNKAKLMYYLNCTCSVLQLDDPRINRLTQYNNYRLGGDETDALVALCYLLSPDVLLDKCIFHSEEMCGNSSNK